MQLTVLFLEYLDDTKTYSQTNTVDELKRRKV